MRVKIDPAALSTLALAPKPASSSFVHKVLATRASNLRDDKQRLEYLEGAMQAIAFITQDSTSSLACDIHKISEGAITRVILSKQGGR